MHYDHIPSLYTLLSSHSCKYPLLVSPPPWLMPFLSFFSLLFPAFSFPFFYLSLSFFKKNDSLKISFNRFSACTTLIFSLKLSNIHPTSQFQFQLWSLILLYNPLTPICPSASLLDMEVFRGVWSHILEIISHILKIIYLILSWKLSSLKSSSVSVRMYVPYCPMI